MIRTWIASLLLVAAVVPASAHAEPSPSGDAVQTRRRASDPRRPAGRKSRGERTRHTPPALSATTAVTTTTVSTVKAPCLRDAVQVLHGREKGEFPLTRCDGSVAPLAVEHLSVLARSENTKRPLKKVSMLSKTRGAELAPGIRRLDSRLVDRLQRIVDHFATATAGSKKQAPRVELVSGYRPNSKGSFHAHGRALDFRLEGVKNEDLVAFCKTLVDAGCGFYPNSSFIHLDVRDTGTGHVAWIDASGPGEAPRYVPSWPLPQIEATTSERAMLPADDGSSTTPHELPAVRIDEHPSVAGQSDDEDDASER